jgi:nucleotide-binding universal stress UspA family protein
MLKRILVPLDGSKLAERSLQVATSFAAKTGAELRLLTVHIPLALRYGDPIMIPGDPLDRDVERHEREYVESLATEVRKRSGTEVGAAVLGMRYSLPATIVSWARTQRADCIVMSTHGELGPGAPWLGSVADGVLRTSELPVLLVPPEFQVPPAGLSPDEIVVPLDGSALSERILGLASSLATKLGAPVTLVRVVPKYAEPGMSELLRLAREYLGGAETRASKLGAKVSSRAVVSNHAAKAILEFADSSPGRMVVMTTRGRGGLRRLLLGSVADKVARGSRKPVILVQPPRVPKRKKGSRA